MNETKEQTKPIEWTPSKETDKATWQAPSYEVVDTALEVTAYSLSSR
ncbi:MULTISPECIES: pyrroloquinoline quinone precursor peptide PqqA [unclassified Streptomyces]